MYRDTKKFTPMGGAKRIREQLKVIPVNPVERQHHEEKQMALQYLSVTFAQTRFRLPLDPLFIAISSGWLYIRVERVMCKLLDSSSFMAKSYPDKWWIRRRPK